MSTIDFVPEIIFRAFRAWYSCNEYDEICAWKILPNSGMCENLLWVRLLNQYILRNYETENHAPDESVCNLRTAFLAHPIGWHHLFILRAYLCRDTCDKWKREETLRWIIARQRGTFYVSLNTDGLKDCPCAKLLFNQIKREKKWKSFLKMCVCLSLVSSCPCSHFLRHLRQLSRMRSSVWRMVFTITATEIVPCARNHTTKTEKSSSARKSMQKANFFCHAESAQSKTAMDVRVMRIFLVDHVIIGDGDYYSFRDNGKIWNFLS